MTVLEELQEKVKDIDAFAEWYEENCAFDNNPAIDWYDRKYCQKCESVFKDKSEYAYCELCHKCRFFPDMEEEPDYKQIIKLWLQSGG